jgi:hypothetical protein
VTFMQVREQATWVAARITTFPPYGCGSVSRYIVVRVPNSCQVTRLTLYEHFAHSHSLALCQCATPCESSIILIFNINHDALHTSPLPCSYCNACSWQGINKRTLWTRLQCLTRWHDMQRFAVGQLLLSIRLLVRHLAWKFGIGHRLILSQWKDERLLRNWMPVLFRYLQQRSRTSTYFDYIKS